MLLNSFFNKKTAQKEFLICTLPILFFTGTLPCNDAVRKGNDNNWSGTITFVSTIRVHRAGPYSETIYEKYDHFYEQRMEAKVANGKGLATSTIALLDTSYNREQTGSRITEQWEITKGTAAGSGDTEVSITFSPTDKTYTIEAPIPATQGNKTKTFICKGCGQPAADPITSSMGEDETSILVENEKPGADPNVLTGERTERKQIDNGNGEEIDVTRWKFTRGKN